MVAAVVAIIVMIAVITQPSPERVLTEDVKMPIWNRSNDEVLSGIEKRMQAIDSNYTLEISPSDSSNGDTSVFRVMYNENFTDVFLVMSNESKVVFFICDGLANKETSNAFWSALKAFLFENDWRNNYSNTKDVDHYVAEIFNTIDIQSINQKYSWGHNLDGLTSFGEESISGYFVEWIYIESKEARSIISLEEIAQ